MARAHFAEILSSRRKQLGLSIPQAAKVLRYRESVLVAFEDGDFERLPALGYAQGMVAGYARYLGLDSRRISELYEREHDEYLSGHGLSRQGLARLDDEPNAGFSTSVMPPRPASPRPSATPLLPGPSAGAGPSGAARRDSRAGSDAYGYRRQDVDRPRRYTTRIPEERSCSRDRQGRAQRDRLRERSDRPRGSYRPYRGDITTRRVNSGQYRDDLRYDESPRPYRSASTRSGRQAARTQSRPERPNVRRRQSSSTARDPRARSRRPQPRPTGLAGVLSALLSDSRRVMALVIVTLSLALALILVFSIRSCAVASDEPRQVSVLTASSSTTASATTLSATEQAALSEAAARQAAASAQAAATETVVKVSVAEGTTTWVEITNDGTQQVAETVKGPWEQQYTVTKTIDVRVGDASGVTVEKNGERVSFSSRQSGMQSVSIQGTDPSAAAAATAEAATTSPSSKRGSSSSSSSSGE